VQATKDYLLTACPSGQFSFLKMPFADHTDAWVLRDIPPREAVRRWFTHVLNNR
jgi:hypothetical protein